jgi:hypothetical protein
MDWSNLLADILHYFLTKYYPDSLICSLKGIHILSCAKYLYVSAFLWICPTNIVWHVSEKCLFLAVARIQLHEDVIMKFLYLPKLSCLTSKVIMFLLCCFIVNWIVLCIFLKSYLFVLVYVCNKYIYISICVWFCIGFWYFISKYKFEQVW